MAQEPEFKRTGFQRVAIQAIADQDFEPSKPKVLRSLTALLNELEFHRTNSAHRIQSTVRVPGWLSEAEEKLLPFVRDPIGASLNWEFDGWGRSPRSL